MLVPFPLVLIPHSSKMIIVNFSASLSANLEQHLGGEQQHHRLPRPCWHHHQCHDGQIYIGTYMTIITIVLLRINVKTLILLLKLWMYGQQFLTILIARVETYVWLKCITGSTMWKFLPRCSFQELLRIHKGFLDLFLRQRAFFNMYSKPKGIFLPVFETQRAF